MSWTNGRYGRGRKRYVEVCDVGWRSDEEKQELRNTMAQLEFDGLE
jgi:hypothetical protein